MHKVNCLLELNLKVWGHAGGGFVSLRGVSGVSGRVSLRGVSGRGVS